MAGVIDAVPGLNVRLPPTAVGRDYPADGKWVRLNTKDGFRISLAGYAGLALGGQRGFEVNVFGLVAGFDPSRGEIKIPGFGSVTLWNTSTV